jgi:hypothetical protein
MILINNLFSSLIIEALIGVYLINHLNKIKMNSDDNIYRQWSERYNEKENDGPYSFFAYKSSFWKKYYNFPKGNTKTLTDQFSKFIDDIQVYLQTFCIIFCVILFLFLLLKIFTTLINKSLKIRPSHILQPGTFDSKSGNIRDWLENFDVFLEEDGIESNNEKCKALLSRLSPEDKKLISNTSSLNKKDYDKLKAILLKIFGGKVKTTTEYATELVACRQAGRNLYVFHATLVNLARKAHPTLSQSARDNIINELFIDGISNEALKAALLLRLKEQATGYFRFGYKSVLDMAVELNDIYGRESIDINEVHARMNSRRRQADTGTICYNCYEKGHFKNDCKKPKKQNLNDQQSDNQQVKSNALVLNRISQSNAISGNCVIDDNVTSFMADTGAEMTVIDVEVLQPDQRMDIKPTNFDVILADGSKADVLGMKMCNITVGNDTVQLEVLVTTRLNQTCLLGIDFLRKCPSTKTLVHNLESALNGESLTINSIGTNVEDGTV